MRPEVEERSEEYAKLSIATKQLEEDYYAFITYNDDIIIENELFSVFDGLGSDIREATRSLQKAIRVVIEKRDVASQAKLTTIGNFIEGLYPIARVSLSLISGVVAVSSFLFTLISRLLHLDP